MNTEDVSVNNTEDTSSQTEIECEEKAVEKKQQKTSKKKLPTLYVQTDYNKDENIVTRFLFAFYWAGELPMTILKITNSYQAYSKTLRQMREDAIYVNKVTKEKITGKALKIITMKRKSEKILRLTETGKRLLGWLGLREEYEEHFERNASDDVKKERACRVGEVIFMNFAAGFGYTFDDEIRFQDNQDVHMCNIKKIAEIKRGGLSVSNCVNEYGVPNDDGEKKILGSRICGMVVSRQDFFAVYNTRSSLMKWSMETEKRVADNIGDAMKKYIDKRDFSKSILLASSYRVGMCLLEEQDLALCGYLNKRGDHFDDLYSHVYCIPYDRFGVGLYEYLVRPGWLERVYRLFLNENEMQKDRHVGLEYDGEKDGKYVLFFFDGDIARLHRVKLASHKYNKKLIVYCFEKQADFVDAYLSRDWESVKNEPEDKRYKEKKRCITEFRKREIESMYDKYKDGFYELRVINWNQFEDLFDKTYNNKK